MGKFGFGKTIEVDILVYSHNLVQEGAE